MSEKQNFVVGIISVTGSSCTGLEQEYQKGFPENVQVVMSYAPLEKVSYDELMRFMDALPQAAEEFGECAPDLLIVPSMTGSCIRGHEIVNMLEQYCGIPVIVPSLELVKVLKELNKDLISIVSAFGVELGLLEQLFFRNHGIKVDSIVSVYDNPDGDRLRIENIDSRTVLGAVEEADFQSAQAVVFDSPTYQLDSIREEIKAHIKRPVLSVNQVLIYSALKRLGLSVEDNPIAEYFKS